MPPRQQTDARSSLHHMKQGNVSLAAKKNWRNRNYKHNTFRGEGVPSRKKKNSYGLFFKSHIKIISKFILHFCYSKKI